MCTREAEVEQDSTFPVPDAADGGEVNVQDQEKYAAEETGHAHSDTVVTGIGVVVKDAEQTLTADVDVALVHDAAEHHYGEDLQKERRDRRGYLLSDRQERMKSHCFTNASGTKTNCFSFECVCVMVSSIIM